MPTDAVFPAAHARMLRCPTQRRAPACYSGPMAEQQLAWTVGNGRLAGTLLLPEGAGPWPGALLIAGSGPTDRDGNNLLLPAPIDNLRRLAQELAARGIASLRYDKRGVGESVHPGLSEEALRFDHLVDDAVLLARQLADDPRITQVTLVGHSEGALVAALAADEAHACGVVSVSGAGCSVPTLMRKQIEASLPPDLVQPALAALAKLEAQEPVADVPESLVLLFRPSVQPYLISWFRHDPPQVLGRLHAPVLIVHGAADAQVPPEHAQWLHEGRPDAPVKIVQGMDHLLAVGGDVPAGVRMVAGEVAEWLQEMAGVAA